MRFFFLLNRFHKLRRNTNGLKELSVYKELCEVPAAAQEGLMGCTAEEELLRGGMIQPPRLRHLPLVSTCKCLDVH